MIRPATARYRMVVPATSTVPSVTRVAVSKAPVNPFEEFGATRRSLDDEAPAREGLLVDSAVDAQPCNSASADAAASRVGASLIAQAPSHGRPAE